MALTLAIHPKPSSFLSISSKASILSQVFPTTTSLVSDISLRLRRSSVDKTSNVSSFDKRAPSVACMINEYEPVRPVINFEGGSRPTNSYTIDMPHTATICSAKKISGSTYRVVFDHNGDFRYWEGQHFGVMVPAKDASKTGNDKKISRFHSASSRYGEKCDGKTVSLCVRLVPGTTSEFLCKSSAGEEIKLIGPDGEAMLLGDYSPTATHIFVATGTGIAPFRAHLRRFFGEKIPKFTFKGFVWLFHGVCDDDDSTTPYKEDFEKYERKYPKNFRYVATSKKYYVMKRQSIKHTFSKHAEKVFDMLVKGAYIYLCGRREMVKPIKEALNDVAKKRGKESEKELAELLNNGKRWRVEVY